jgi:2-oxoglutarate dehydrogenase E2 component (dihydrolipoamide succinyltransferase)
MAEATMLTWKKKAGEAVAVDEILIEIETDKVVLEVPAPAGVITEIVQGDGATVAADQLIAKIDTEAVAGAAAPAAAPACGSCCRPVAAAPAAATRAVWPCPLPPRSWPTTTCRLPTWLAPARTAA